VFIIAEMGAHEEQARFGLKDHWRCLVAMTLVSLCTFQYGLDFGVIGGLQAMVPFLEVGFHLILPHADRIS